MLTWTRFVRWLAAHVADLILAAVAVVFVGLIAGNLLSGVKQRAAVETTTAQAGQTVAGAQASAASDAVGIADAGRQRDDRTIIIRQENANALQTSPGADARLDDELVRRLARGMCRYDATAGDPGCAEVRATDPEVVP